MAGNSKTLTIFMYPWFAMGHLTPYLLTDNKFTKRGHKIFIIIPPSAQSRLDPLNLYPDLIKFKPISIPHIEGLPTQVETTNNDVTIKEKQLLRHALDITQPTIQSLLYDLRPDFVFYDFIDWLSGLACHLQINSVYYCLVSPAALGFMFAEGPLVEDLMSGLEGFPSSIKLYKYAARGLKFLGTTKEMGSRITMKQHLITSICESDAIGFKTCKEIEGELLCKIRMNASVRYRNKQYNDEIISFPRGLSYQLLKLG